MYVQESLHGPTSHMGCLVADNDQHFSLCITYKYIFIWHIHIHMYTCVHVYTYIICRIKDKNERCVSAKCKKLKSYKYDTHYSKQRHFPTRLTRKIVLYSSWESHRSTDRQFGIFRGTYCAQTGDRPSSQAVWDRSGETFTSFPAPILLRLSSAKATEWKRRTRA